MASLDDHLEVSPDARCAVHRPTPQDFGAAAWEVAFGPSPEDLADLLDIAQLQDPGTPYGSECVAAVLNILHDPAVMGTVPENLIPNILQEAGTVQN